MIRQDRSFSAGGGFIIFILNSIYYTVETMLTAFKKHSKNRIIEFEY